VNLPLIPTDNADLMLLQTRWKSLLDRLLGVAQANTLTVTLTSGANVINHKLGKQLTGWYVVDINAPITLYRSAPATKLTLTLTASGPATCTLMVF